MDAQLPIAGAIVLMIGCLLLVPIGLPGLWLMLTIIFVGVVTGEVAWWVFLLLTVVAGLAEVAEFLVVRWTSARYGGSNRAFWGALAGGLAGMLIGMPVPVVGSLIAGLIGTFLGAALVTWRETRHMRSAGRVAWGALLGRGFAAAVKTAAGVAILVVGAWALLAR